MRMPHFSDTEKVWVLDGGCVFDTIYIPYKNFSYLDKIAQVSRWFRMALTKIITWVFKNSLTLTYPPNINTPIWYLASLTIWSYIVLYLFIEM
jgi:hypothetical protein